MASFCYLISDIFGYKKYFQRGMLGWTNSNVVCMEFTYSLNVSSSNYYPPQKKQTNRHTPKPPKNYQKKTPKIIKTINMQNIFIIINVFEWNLFFFLKSFAHSCTEAWHNQTHNIQGRMIIIIINIVVAMATYVMTWLMTMGSGGINKPWSFPGISANFILLHSKIWNSIIWQWIIKEGENSQYHYK